MNKKRNLETLDKMVPSVDEYFEPKREWTKGDVGEIILHLLPIALLALILVILSIAVGFIYSDFQEPTQLMALVAFIALVVSFMDMLNKDNSIFDRSEWVNKCIQWNFKKLSNEYVIAEEKEPLLRALIKMKIQQPKISLSTVINSFSGNESVWIAWLYGVGDTSELFK